MHQLKLPNRAGNRSPVEGDKRTEASSREGTPRMRRSIRPTRATTSLDASVDPTEARSEP
jgi:hypothetical protein